MSKKKNQFLDDILSFVYPQTEDTIFIYFVVSRMNKNNHWSSRVKIGISKDVKKRIITLQTGNPFEIKLWYLFEVDKSNAAEYEKKLHRKFRWSRTHGEWFEIRSCIRKWIAMHKILSIEKEKGKEYFIKEHKEVILRKFNR